MLGRFFLKALGSLRAEVSKGNWRPRGRRLAMESHCVCVCVYVYMSFGCIGERTGELDDVGSVGLSSE